MNRTPLGPALVTIAIAACAGVVAAFADGERETPSEPVDARQVLRGRQLVMEHACGGCHAGVLDPATDGWLAGWRDSSPPGAQDFRIGPFRTYARNLTPDNMTGLGRFSERQIFNALRFGLRPGETADVEITSSTPGQGNFPEHPKYLAPPMPWTAWRHMPDEDLRSIAAYLKRGIRAVRNKVPDSEGPPDFWASRFTVEAMGTFPAPPYPTANELTPHSDVVDLDRVLRGRQLVIQHACGECHGGMNNPAARDWLAGAKGPDDENLVGIEPRGTFFDCKPEPGTACYRTRPRNLTPDSLTGVGRFSERQIFNALRYGLRPGKTPDIAITSSVRGQGNFPEVPNYLAPAMPWAAWRHMADEDLWAIAAYLRHGVRPVRHDVPDSEEPADHWASQFTLDKIGPYPARSFPTTNEVATAVARARGREGRKEERR
jgi:mono/diheme cytochrome c family protein